MLGRQSVKVTYAHKRRRVQNVGKKLFSSPLEALPPDMDDLTRTQMARRMLKRSRRAALAEQLEDRNVEHIKEHLAKRIKRTQERVSNLKPDEGPFGVSPQDDFTFQTPFSSQLAHESIVTVPVPEQLSPVPVAKRVMSRTSSRKLKENSTRSQILASPFCSRPGSAASSPKHKSGGRSFRRVSRVSHAQSRTLSGVFKENSRRLSRKYSTMSLKDAEREPSARHIRHQRCPSSPSASYMRSQLAREDWVATPEISSRTFDDHDDIPSPDGSIRSNASFYADQPQFCSTPAISRARKLPGLYEHQTRADDYLAFSLHQGSREAGGPDVEMMDDTVPPRRQTIHLSGNSIFSSSGELTIGLISATRDGRTSTNDRDGISRRVPAHHEMADGSQVDHSVAGSFIAEYDIPLPDSDHSLAPIAATRMFGSEGVPKVSVGEQPLDLPGTSSPCGENLVIHSSRSSAAKSSVSELLSLPGTSPARGESLVIRTSRNPNTLTPPALRPNINDTCPPSSPASDLALELQSMDIRGDTHSDGETGRPTASIPLQVRSHSLQDAHAESSTKKFVKHKVARDRAATIRASDFPNPGVLSSVAPGTTIPPLSNVRRTRSGTIVGPDSKLATKGAPTARLPAVQSGSESESDDELLLKGFWMEDLEYLGLAIPAAEKDANASADELNLGGLLHGLESCPQRRLRSR